MSEEEILHYILCCVSYKHMFDLSPQITESAKRKEDLLFSSAVFFLRELSISKNITMEVGPDDRFEVTEKGKEYLSSH